MSETTIAAVATPLGTSGISIIKMSGDKAFAVCDRLFACKGGFMSLAPNTITYGRIVDPRTGEEIDRVLVSKMAAPRTYTGEDVVEINCHGGMFVTRRILRLVMSEGAVPAAPGEFTKRAFLNGKIDLLQAEATMDLIGARAEQAARSAVRQLEGSLSARLARLADALADICAKIDLSTDFDELDAFDYTPADVAKELSPIIDELSALEATFDSGRKIRDGLSAVICGRPNAGKSSLLNALLGEERAIVTDIPGTTRDTVEEVLNLSGYAVRFVDTAGLRSDDEADTVERIGIGRTRDSMRRADVIIFVADLTADIGTQIREASQVLSDCGKGTRSIMVYNKTDAADEETVERFKKASAGLGFTCKLAISAATGEGLDSLRECILAECRADDELMGRGMLVNERQRLLTSRARQYLVTAADAGRAGLPLDVLYADIRYGVMALNELTGRRIDMEAIDRMFESFCVGK